MRAELLKQKKGSRLNNGTLLTVYNWLLLKRKYNNSFL